MGYYLMCDDIERAALNRNIISKKLYIWAYLQVEAWLSGYNIHDLPYWMYERGLIQQNSKIKLQGSKKGGLKGGKARAQKLTSKQRSESARKGGIARAKKLTPERRSKIAKKASHSRKIYLA